MTEKKAILKSNLVYILLTLGFVSLMFGFIWFQSNGASLWADFYAKELSRIINLAKPGDKISLDVHKATVVAARNNIPPTKFNEIFQFDNPKNEICVKLSQGIKTCYSYFNEVDIINPHLELGKLNNVLVFEIKETPKQNSNNNENSNK